MNWDVERKYRVCEWLEETWKHVLDGCMRGKEERGGQQDNFRLWKPLEGTFYK